MLRLIVNKAKTHFNTALELAERERDEEAVSELRNALDLDNNHVNSHVVLGTLYAKSGQLDKAREQWDEALALDPRFEKAHQYLIKGESAARALPVCRRQRRFILSLIAVLCAVFVLFLLQGSRVPDTRPLQNAWTLYRDQNYSAAIKYLSELSKKMNKSEVIAGQADMLLEMIITEQRLLINTAQQEFDRGRLAQADAVLWELLKRAPTPAYMEEARALQSRTLQAAREELRRSLEAYGRREIALEAVQASLDTYKGLRNLPPVQDDAFLVQIEAELRDTTLAHRLSDIQTEFETQTIDEWTYLDKLVALSRDYPGNEAVPDIIHALADPLEALWTREIELAIQSAQLDVAAQRFALLERLLNTVSPDSAKPKIEKLEKALAERRTALEKEDSRRKAQADLAKLREAHQAGDYESVVELGGAIADSPWLEELEKNLVAAMVARSQPRLALERWMWIVERDREYLNQTISIEDAKRTIAIYPQVAEHLSRRAYPAVQDDLLLYLALAYRSLDMNEESHAAIDRIKKEHPDNSVQTWVKKYERPN
jgi:tetratricopeptide (TPR) repeat protein